MTILTDNQDLILIAPDQNMSGLLLQLQYQQFQAFVDASPENKASFDWLQPDTEDYE
ncbi:MAG: hypothetical protein S4CHLAM6_11960 [Chlamydiae bacterium]|nr:hypothetical protein [Chlamydiota bacterium]